MAAFDTEGDGKINFDEFLAGIRGRLNATRLALLIRQTEDFWGQNICASFLVNKLYRQILLGRDVWSMFRNFLW